MAIINSYFEHGLYPVVNGTITNDGFEYGLYPLVTPTGGGAGYPPALVALAPIAGKRSPNTPIFTMTCGADPNGKALSFKLEVASSTAFNTPLYVVDSSVNATGWHYSTDNGQSWVAFPSNGKLTLSGTVQIKHISTFTLSVGQTLYWRVNSKNDTYSSQTYSVNTLYVGDKMTIQLKSPIPTTAPAKNIFAVVGVTLPTNGSVPSAYRVFACNNGLDPSPTWEDITSTTKTSGTSYQFSNQTKVANSWAVGFKVELVANDSTGEIALNSYGFTYN